MTIIKHELKQGGKSLLIWTASIAFLVMICIFMFPEMKGEMESVTDMFASMGSFTAAFGMDRLNFGSFIGFYSIECGNILGLGGAFFAALIAVSALAKEEKERTAEFLLTHPVTRFRVVTEKLIAVMVEIILMNAAVYILSVASVAVVGEEIPWKEFNLINIAFLIMQIELAAICFGLSAFLSRGGAGIGIGLAVTFYFLNIIANISDSAKFLKYLTPFGYTEAADIVTDCKLDAALIAVGAVTAAVAICAAYIKYCKKDIK